jgi:hypothetical protein
MKFNPGRNSLIILGIIALACSRIFFMCINDYEGPNLLVTLVLALSVYALSLTIYWFAPALPNLKKLLLAVLIQIIAVALLAVIASDFLYHKNNQEDALPVKSSAIQNNTHPTFTWNFENASSLNPDGIPQTNVYLTATYQDGTIISKKIDTTDGSCNELPDADKDSLDHTTVIQCYAAGFGYTYKIVKGSDTYLVQRKGFEEATPEQKPVDYKYETVSEFSFSGK